MTKAPRETAARARPRRAYFTSVAHFRNARWSSKDDSLNPSPLAEMAPTARIVCGLRQLADQRLARRRFRFAMRPRLRAVRKEIETVLYLGFFFCLLFIVCLLAQHSMV